MAGAEARRLVVAEHARRRARRTGPACSSTRSRCRSCSPGGSAARRPRTGTHVRKAADFVVANGPRSPAGALGEPGRLLAEHDRHGDRRAGLRGRHRARHGDAARATRVRGARRRVAGRRWSRGRPRTNGPLLAQAVLPAPHQGRPNPRRRQRRTTSVTTSPPNPVDEREVVDQSFLGLVLFGVKAHDDPAIRNSLAVGDESLKADTPHGADLAPVHLRRLRRDRRRRRLDDLPDGRQTPDARAAVAAADRRAGRVRAARRPAARRRTWRRSPRPPTTA